VQPEYFPTTDWSLLHRVECAEPADSSEHLDQLLKRYLPAMQAYLVRGRHLNADQAEDILQSFVAREFLQKSLVGKADPARGRFRTLLLTVLDRYVVSEFRRASAKRRSAEPPQARDLESAEARLEEGAMPSDVFDVEWARVILTEALRRMEHECRAKGHSEVWEVFRLRVILPCLHDAKPLSYKDMVSRMELRSPTQASNLLVTGKRTFVRCLESVVAEYANSPEEVHDEILDLKQILSKCCARSNR